MYISSTCLYWNKYIWTYHAVQEALALVLVELAAAAMCGQAVVAVRPHLRVLGPAEHVDHVRQRVRPPHRPHKLHHCDDRNGSSEML